MASATDPDPSAAKKWARRALTVPGLLLLCVLDLVVLPVLLASAVLVDLVKHQRYATVRFHLAVAFALGIHLVGMGMLLGAWVAGLAGGRGRERRLDLESEVWWATAIWRGAMRLYGMRVEVEGEDALGVDGPVVLMSRHASLLDTLLPVVYAAGRHGRRLRYVAKRELLWDPFFDFAGHRLATAFVQRHGRTHAHDLAAVESLAEGLEPRDAIVIYPEGTRSSPAKQALAKLAARDDAALAHASRLHNLLPPHLGGPLRLLEHAPHAGVIFCAHTGLEGANHLGDLLAGSLIDATVRVRYWHVAASEIPTEREARVAWLRTWWEHLDAWVDTTREPIHVAA